MQDKIRQLTSYDPIDSADESSESDESPNAPRTMIAADWRKSFDQCDFGDDWPDFSDDADEPLVDISKVDISKLDIPKVLQLIRERTGQQEVEKEKAQIISPKNPLHTNGVSCLAFFFFFF